MNDEIVRNPSGMMTTLEISTTDRRHLAEALAQLESLRLTTPNTLLAATGGSLMNRISRILGTPSNKTAARLGNRSFFSGAIALLLVAVGLNHPGNRMRQQLRSRDDHQGGLRAHRDGDA